VDAATENADVAITPAAACSPQRRFQRPQPGDQRPNRECADPSSGHLFFPTMDENRIGRRKIRLESTLSSDGRTPSRLATKAATEVIALQTKAALWTAVIPVALRARRIEGTPASSPAEHAASRRFAAEALKG
jgi:hypothetical protein